MLLLLSTLEDFPPDDLEPYDVEAQHPDEFIRHLLDLNPRAVCEVVEKQRRNLKKTPKTQEEHLDTLFQLGLPQSVSLLWELCYEV